MNLSYVLYVKLQLKPSDKSSGVKTTIFPHHSRVNALCYSVCLNVQTSCPGLQPSATLFLHDINLLQLDHRWATRSGRGRPGCVPWAHYSTSLGVCSKTEINHRRRRRRTTLFPSHLSSALMTISMHAVFKLRHASENCYLMSDTSEENKRCKIIWKHIREYGWLQCIQEIFSCQHG